MVQAQTHEDSNKAGKGKNNMLVSAVNPAPTVLPTLGVWQSEDSSQMFVASMFPNVPDFRCDAWLYECGDSITFARAEALDGGRVRLHHAWKDHPYDIVTTVTPEPGAIEFLAHVEGEGAAELGFQEQPGLNLCWQLKNAPAFCSKPDPFPYSVSRCFIFTDAGRTFLNNTVRNKLPCRPSDDPYNNPPWVQMYSGVWEQIPEAGPTSWADYSDDRYVVPVIGCISRDGNSLAALANDSADSMGQAWHDCEHNNPKWLPTSAGGGFVWRLKVYVMENDPDKLLAHVVKDFPNALKLAEKRVPPQPEQ